MNYIIKINLNSLFSLFNVLTRKFKIAYMAQIRFDSTALETGTGRKISEDLYSSNTDLFIKSEPQPRMLSAATSASLKLSLLTFSTSLSISDRCEPLLTSLLEQIREQDMCCLSVEKLGPHLLMLGSSYQEMSCP